MVAHAHAHLGASNSSIWLNCAEAGRKMRTLPSGAGSVYAAEGTVAHALVENWFEHGDDPASQLGKTAVLDGFHIPIGPDMIDAAKTAIDYIELLIAGPGRGTVQIERPVSMEPLFDLVGRDMPEPMFGTADAVVRAGEFLHVVDFKYGAGVPVEASSPQLRFYGLAAWLAAGADEKIRVVAHVVQPRAPHKDGFVRRMEYSQKALLAFGDEIVEAVERIAAGKGGYVSGEHCRFCPLAGRCPELARRNAMLAAAEFAEVDAPKDPIPPKELSDADLSFVLSRLPVFEKWVGAVKLEALTRMTEGRTVPDWKLVLKRGIRKWDETKLPESVKKSMSETVLLSPARSEAVLGRKAMKELAAAGAVVVKTSGPIAVHKDDPRPEWVPTQAAIEEFRDADDADPDT
jgi:hypothetical protein